MRVDIRQIDSDRLLEQIEVEVLGNRSFLVLQRRNRYRLRNGIDELASLALQVKTQRQPADARWWQGRQQAWGHGLGRSWRDLPPAVAVALAASVSDLEDRLRILDALYIPTRYPDSLPDGAPTDHLGRLQSEDALRHARSIVDAIAAALA